MITPCKEEPIAIVGAACRFSGKVTSLRGLWNMISNGRSGHGKVPPSRWDADTWYHPDPDRKGSVTGVPMDSLTNSQTGVYVGCMTNDYEQLSTHDPCDIGDLAASGTSDAMIANRVSWFFGLRGPSLTLDTACSSSLYALHLASNGYGRGEGIGCLVVKRLKDAVRDGDTIRAVIRGTGVNADGKTPGITQPSSEAQTELIRTTYETAGLSLTDTQYFEAHGTGTSLGVGRTLGAARSGEEPPLYVGSIKPNLGHTEGCSGIAGVLKSILCLENGVLIPTVGIEKLNPKLKLGDWNLALPSQNMAWPSKGQRRVSVNSFGFGGANAHVILDDAYHFLRNHGLVGNHTTTCLEDDFSDSGIDHQSDLRSPYQEEPKRLFVFSTRDQAGIERLAPLYADFLSNTAATSQFLTDLAFTLSDRRTQLEFRSFAIADSSSALETQLRKGLPQLKRASKHDNPIFVFTGQGAQWPAMGKELLNNCIFRTSIEKSQVLLEHYGCEWDLVDELSKTTDSNVDLPQYSQVLCTILQIALVDLLRRCNAVKVAYLRGICSAKAAGNASSPVGAMAAAGLSEEEAAKYLEQVAPGSVVVACVNSPCSITFSGDGDAVTRLCQQISAHGKFARLLRVKTAYHSPAMQKVAREYLDGMGTIVPLATEDQVAPMFSSLTGTTVTAKDLDGSYWKRNMCEKVRFAQAVKTLLEYVPEEQQAMGHKRTPWSAFIEIGPHAALQGPVAEITETNQSKSAKEAPYFSAILRGKDSELTTLELAGKLWSSGHNVKLSRVNFIYPESLPISIPDLPSYPWSHTRKYWHESATARSSRLSRGPRTDLLGWPVDLQNAMEPRWRNYIRIPQNPWIEDHKITGTVLYPAAGMIVMAMEAAYQLRDTSKHLTGISFRNLKFDHGLVVESGDQSVQTEVSLRPDTRRAFTWDFAVYSIQAGGVWTRHSYGALSLEYSGDGNHDSDTAPDGAWPVVSSNWVEIQKNEFEEVDIETFYDELEAVGVQYGPTFRNVFQAGISNNEHCAVGCISIPDTKSTMPYNYEFPHIIHPATMDALFHLLFIAFSDGKSVREAAVPYTLEHMYVSMDLPQGHGSVFKGYAKRLRMDGREMSGDLVVSDEAWSSPKVIARNFVLRQVTSSGETNNHSSRRVCAKLRWKEDVDFTRSPMSLLGKVADESGLPCDGTILTAISVLFDRLHHKNSGYRILISMQDATETSRDWVRAFLNTGGNGANGRVRKAFIAIATSNTNQLSETSFTEEEGQVELKEWNPNGEEMFPFRKETFDIVFIIKAPTTKQSDLSAMFTLQESLGPMGILGVVNLNDGLFSSTEVESIIEPAGLEKIAVLSDGIQAQSLLLTRKLSSTNDEMKPSEVFLLCRTERSLECKQLEKLLANGLQLMGCEAKTATLLDTEQLKGTHVISLLEVESPLVNKWTEEEFTQFKRLVSVVSNMLWVTRGGIMESWNGGLEFAPSQGLMRVMRTEYPHIFMPHLDLSRTRSVHSPSVAETILDVWRVSIRERGHRQLEMEYAEGDGAIFVPRFIEDSSLDANLNIQSGIPQPVQGRLSDDTQWRLDRTDKQFMWAEEATGSRTLIQGEVKIKVDYMSLQKAPISPERGSNAIQAIAVSGIILDHLATTKAFEVGQRVVALHPGPCHTTLVINEEFVRLLPPLSDSPSVLKTITALFAANYALMEASRLEKGQTVLIYGAETHLGQAALQRASLAGAKVFTTTKGPSERLETVSKNSLAEVSRQIQGHEADIILNCIQDEFPSGLFKLLAPFGTFVDVGYGRKSTESSKPLSCQNATFVTANLSQLLEARPTLAKRIFAETVDLVEEGRISLRSTDRTESISSLNGVGTQLAKKEVGEFEVLHVDRSVSVTILPTRIPELRLDANGIYVLAGGLGALGVQIAELMFKHGAGHVVFLSRSGGEKNKEVLESFRQRGLSVDALRCDISDASQLKDALRELQSARRHIKGDAIFENMTFEQWKKSARPKIQGTINLHQQMPRDLDFFILLSSITCVIGNAAQSNYAAGNTFEDAFAHFRRSQGLAATAIDVGLVTDSAHFTGNFDMEAYLQMYEHRWDGLQTTQSELNAVLQAAMSGRTADGRPIEPQIVLGLGFMAVGSSSALWTKDPKFNHRINHFSSRHVETGANIESAKERLSKAVNFQNAVRVVESILKGYAAHILGINTQDVDVEKAFYDFGGMCCPTSRGLWHVLFSDRYFADTSPLTVDSLKAVELRNRIFREMESDVSVFELLSPSPLSKLSVEVAARFDNSLEARRLHWKQAPRMPRQVFVNISLKPGEEWMCNFGLLTQKPVGVREAVKWIDSRCAPCLVENTPKHVLPTEFSVIRGSSVRTGLNCKDL
ncbi:PKSN polyketide synthase for alternapyrone biosynthesis protein [Colletotrichum navitas]|uniref:PKSN polyketide synthase for alternapyrone biosynthesis protein n=1 Tax=Colletotrichum navitas TaxID=681940 RepID=A0AAD8PKE0_9PEZI|nr:PKSN polyketide synthase for alternapyrone biosynthesis protein [Colletotrichum navitas]KAK1566009.1 PKSN polyketide synthase for alternapyrone biosynthesis protein [Colletotrichum navitas]